MFTIFPHVTRNRQYNKNNNKPIQFVLLPISAADLRLSMIYKYNDDPTIIPPKKTLSLMFSIEESKYIKHPIIAIIANGTIFRGLFLNKFFILTKCLIFEY